MIKLIYLLLKLLLTLIIVNISSAFRSFNRIFSLLVSILFYIELKNYPVHKANSKNHYNYIQKNYSIKKKIKLKKSNFITFQSPNKCFQDKQSKLFNEIQSYKNINVNPLNYVTTNNLKQCENQFVVNLYDEEKIDSDSDNNYLQTNYQEGSQISQNIQEQQLSMNQQQYFNSNKKFHQLLLIDQIQKHLRFNLVITKNRDEKYINSDFLLNDKGNQNLINEYIYYNHSCIQKKCPCVRIVKLYQRNNHQQNILKEKIILPTIYEDIGY